MTLGISIIQRNFNRFLYLENTFNVESINNNNKKQNTKHNLFLHTDTTKFLIRQRTYRERSKLRISAGHVFIAANKAATV